MQLISFQSLAIFAFAMALQHVLTRYRFDPSKLRQFFVAKRNQELIDKSIQEEAGGTVIKPQPDEIRRTTTETPEAAGVPVGAACALHALAPYSYLTTRDVEVFTQPVYRGARGNPPEHSWSYKVRFTNRGEATVQMLTRHWIFIDGDGKVDEIKGPGARGSTPVIHAGESWDYQSGTSLTTPRGSMTGSFQFEVLTHKDPRNKLLTKAGLPVSFSAPVGRAALSPTNDSEAVPCGSEAALGLVPLTSVLATRRVIVGVTSEFVGWEKEEGSSAPPFRDSGDGSGSDGGEGGAAGGRGPQRRALFQYDVQINNARNFPVTILAHHWVVTEADGRVHTLGGKGMGGHHRINATDIKPQAATRFTGVVAMTGRPAAAQRLRVTLTQLEAFYSQHDPAKLPRAAAILQQYTSAQLEESLARKYGASPLGPADPHADRGGRVGTLAGHFEVQLTELQETVRVTVGALGLAVDGKPVAPPASANRPTDAD
jgi:ApaG protein